MLAYALMPAINIRRKPKRALHAPQSPAAVRAPA